MLLLRVTLVVTYHFVLANQAGKAFPVLQDFIVIATLVEEAFLVSEDEQTYPAIFVELEQANMGNL